MLYVNPRSNIKNRLRFDSLFHTTHKTIKCNDGRHYLSQDLDIDSDPEEEEEGAEPHEEGGDGRDEELLEYFPGKLARGHLITSISYEVAGCLHLFTLYSFDVLTS